jgi:phytoene dehydrogenase-like protein
MNQEYDVIIAGGGLAGLTSAVCLCRNGFRTLLCEKREKTGGLVQTFWHHGFAFDAGIRAFENSGIIFPMLKNFQIDLEFVQNPVSIGIEKEWVVINSCESLRNYAAMLTKIFPDDAPAIEKIRNEIKKVMGYMDVIYGIDNPLFNGQFRDLKYLFRTLLPWMVKYQINIGKAARMNEPIQTCLQRFTQNPALRDMIAQHFFQDTPSFFALSYFSLYLDYQYPIGGTGTLSEKMTEKILAAGGEIKTETIVDQIDLKNREIKTTKGESFRYKKLIWAANQQSLYNAIQGQQSSVIEKQRTLVNRSKGNDSILTLFLGTDIDRDYFRSRCGAHAFYTPSKIGLSSLPAWQDVIHQDQFSINRWIQTYLECTTYEISCPALRDPTLAPEGNTGLIVSTLMDYALVRQMLEEDRYDTFKQFCIDTIIQVLNTSIFPDFREKILFSLCSTPVTIERETGNTQGAITGWSFTNQPIPAVSQTKRINESVYTPMSDIFQCGQWTFSPSGLPISILTGKLAGDAAQKALTSKAKNSSS